MTTSLRVRGHLSSYKITLKKPAFTVSWKEESYIKIFWTIHPVWPPPSVDFIVNVYFEKCYMNKSYSLAYCGLYGSIITSLQETSPPPLYTFPKSDKGELCPPISLTLWNKSTSCNDCPGVRMRESKQRLNFSPALFSHSFDNYFWHFSCVQPSASLLMSSRKDLLKMCAVISIFKQLLYLPALYDGRLFTPPLSVAVGKQL